MLRVRLAESYPNWYWNSGSGVTLLKENREGIEVNEDDRMIRIALEQGFLEVVSDEELKKVKAENKPKDESKIITDTPQNPKIIKEIVTPQNTEEIKKIKEDAVSDGSYNQESTDKGN